VCERVVGDACGVEAVLREADRRPEPRAAGPHHHRVVRVVHHRVGRLESTKHPTKQTNENQWPHFASEPRITARSGKGCRVGAYRGRGEEPGGGGPGLGDAAAPHRAWIPVWRCGGGEENDGRGGRRLAGRALPEHPFDNLRLCHNRF
jgi:hypothetical protein